MGLTLVTGPTQEPLTLENAKLHARIDTDDDDKLCMEFIRAARRWVETQTHRAIITSTWDYAVDWNWPLTQDGLQKIRLPLNPVASITSITYQDGLSPNPTLAAADYTAVLRDFNSYIVPAYNVEWDTVRCVPEAITVRFVAGEAVGSVDSALLMAITMLFTHLYERRDVATEKGLDGNSIRHRGPGLTVPEGGGRIVSIGERRQRVVFQQATITQDAAGEPDKTWTTIATQWALVAPLRGRERQNASETMAEVTTRIVTRNNSTVSALSPGDRATWSGHTYDIKAVIARDHRRSELEILAVEHL